jgi:hypothetical protein
MIVESKYSFQFRFPAVIANVKPPRIDSRGSGKVTLVMTLTTLLHAHHCTPNF